MRRERVHTDNLIFSLNATVPVFLMMVLGYLLHKTPLVDDSFADKMNNFVFKAALPVQLFKSLAEADFHAVWDGGIVLFCFVVSLASILIMLAVSFLLKDKSLRAEFTQAGYRSSQALLGAALLENVYGSTGSLALILIGAVPLYNVAAVVLLTLMTPGGHLNRQTMTKTRKDFRQFCRQRKKGPVEAHAEGDRHQPHHPGHRRRAALVPAPPSPANLLPAVGLHLRGDRHSAGVDCSGRLH